MHSHYRIHSATISFPHGTKPRLAAEIPTGKCQWKIRLVHACMLPLHKMTNHLSVTCPFWTRFMLKPTVGIELRRFVSKCENV